MHVTLKWKLKLFFHNYLDSDGRKLETLYKNFSRLGVFLKKHHSTNGYSASYFETGHGHLCH